MDGRYRGLPVREQEHEEGVVERLIGRDVDEESGKGRRLSRVARQSTRSVESYLKGGVRPRWMERVGEIDARVAHEQRRLAGAHEALAEACAGDPAAFAERWPAVVEAWDFDDLNELVAQHNEWYPIERRLPVDPRTGEYVLVTGRSYRREPLGPRWVLERFPAVRPGA
jgi:hypothetical protein